RYLCPMRFLVPLLLASSISLAAQAPAPTATPSPSPAPIPISPQEALAHRIGHNKPAYPRFALAAGVTGTVKFMVTIGPDGVIQQHGTPTGPPSLLAPAQDWMAASKFRPFLRDGQPVTVTTLLPVVFQLPPGAHSAHPLAALYQRNIATTIDREGRDNPPRVKGSTLSPQMVDWLTRYEAAIDDHTIQAPDTTLDQIVARESAAPRLKTMPGNLAIYQIPLALPHHALYLLFEFSDRFGKSNCPLVLLEESPAGVHTLISQPGLEVDVHRRRDSPYPDLLIWTDSGQPGISSISGYSYYGGEWGQLYCGTDDANEDSVRDEAIADRRGAHPVQPPLVTLCK
ncbi:MAG: energy transducer TonB, partial [Terracidiphilus sp.]